MNDAELSLVRDHVVLGTPLATIAAEYGNIKIEGMSFDRALKTLVNVLNLEVSNGEGCIHAQVHAEPICWCTHALSCLLDMPAEALAERSAFRRAMTMLENHPNQEVAQAAKALGGKLDDRSE